MTVEQERLETCEKCEFLQKAEILNRIISMCSVCNCFVANKAKNPTATCPKDKWTKLNP
jgi:hypothetical protein